MGAQTMRYGIIILAIFGSKVFASLTNDIRIVGGQDAKSGEIPYQVAILFVDVFWCSGSILNENYILTAGQCLQQGVTIEDVKIIVGSVKYNETKPGGVYRASKFIMHEGFSFPPNVKNDIGLIKLATPITFDDSVKPISLPVNNTEAGTNLTVSGWGSYTFPELILSNNLQVLKTTAVSTEKCKQEYSEHSDITDQNLCSLAKTSQGTCFGDSGSPLTDANNSVVGIVSWIEKCGDGKPDVATRVYSYLQWIKDNMK